MSSHRLAALLCGLLLFAGCQDKKGTSALDEEGAATMQLSSSAFRDGDTIPKKYTGDGEDMAPQLSWTGAPEGAKSFAVICEDPDAPRGTWTHWMLFNLPADKRELPEGTPTEENLPSGARQGKNDFGNIGYGGPAPPKGKPHRYFFKVYALDTILDVPAGGGPKQIEPAMRKHILAHGQLIGTYGR
jgi:Raf kinase inhibitor-like YbhB/YbcL family protein